MDNERDPQASATDPAPPPAAADGATLADVVRMLGELQVATGARFEAMSASLERLAIASIARDVRLEERVSAVTNLQTTLAARLGKYEDAVPAVEKSVRTALRSADDLTKYVHDEVVPIFEKHSPILAKVETVLIPQLESLGTKIEARLDAQDKAFAEQREAFARRDLVKSEERKHESLAVQRLAATEAANREFQLKKLSARMPLWLAAIGAFTTIVSGALVYVTHSDTSTRLQRLGERIGTVAPYYEPAPLAPAPLPSEPTPTPAPMPSMPLALPPRRP